MVTCLLFFAAAPSCPAAASPPQLSCQRLSNMQLISTYRNDERSFKTALRMTRRTVGRRTEGRSSAGMCVTPVLPGRRRRLDYYYSSMNPHDLLESLERRSKFPSSTLNESPQNSAKTPPAYSIIHSSTRTFDYSFNMTTAVPPPSSHASLHP